MILSIDVGKGTEDILVIDPKKSFENSIQLVLPSEAQILYQRLEEIKSKKIVISGDLMAGEPYNKIIYQKCSDLQESVIMTETAARSLRYDINQVRSRGVKVIAQKDLPDYLDKGYAHFTLSDINWNRIFAILKSSKISIDQIETVLICCQDHGETNNNTQSARDFRMKAVYGPLTKRGRIEDLLFRSDEIPTYLPRLRSITNSAIHNLPQINKQNVWVMDSSPAVVLGGKTDLVDEVVINIGNGHSLAVYFEDRHVEAIYETHTGGIIPEAFHNDLIDLLRGALTHEAVLKKGGHGVFMRNNLNLSTSEIDKLKPYTVIGPNRKLIVDLPTSFVHPIGSMMMAGPYGLYKAWKEHN